MGVSLTRGFRKLGMLPALTCGLLLGLVSADDAGQTVFTPTDYAAVPRSMFPQVTLDNGTFYGTTDGVVNKFLGIPYARPPVGDLRFRLPVPNEPYEGLHPATFFGPSCPQQAAAYTAPPGFEHFSDMFTTNFILMQVGPWAEDCLTLNVWTPADVAPGTKLPVIAWIFGGGFEAGGTVNIDPTAVMKRSIELQQPVVFVSMEYRLSAFGFLPGQEVKAAGVGNIGLQDQRESLRWIQKYISAFNGDPSKVTLWGGSAGSVSVGLQMLANGGDSEGLFRGAFMLSGSPVPVGDITLGQKYYDALVRDTGCQDAANTLQCLREVPYHDLKRAVDASPHLLSYQSSNLAWGPKVDGVFLRDHPFKLISDGSVADVPFVTGTNDDEGTVFALYSLNVSTAAGVRDYFSSNFFPDATERELDELLRLYPGDPAAGSPFDTGLNNTLTPQYKRIGAFQGDMVFIGPRRFFLQQRSDKQSAWSYVFKRHKAFFPMGSSHGADAPYFLGGGDMLDYVINFVNYLDPNGSTRTHWPKYHPSKPQVLTPIDGPTPFVITEDTFRKEAIDFLMHLCMKYPIGGGGADASCDGDWGCMGAKAWKKLKEL